MKANILIIVGPTASGKSDLAVELALKLGGEVISADSRQVYRGLDIGTGKITQAEMRGVRHWCLDIADPRERFTVADWRKAAEAAEADIRSRGKLPIVVGGTGFYIDALVNSYDLPDVETHAEEQAALEAKPAEDLLKELEALDPRRAAQMKETSNYKNPRRLARAILIARELGAVPPLQSVADTSSNGSVWIGLMPPDAVLRQRIHDRLIKRLDGGMIEEAQRLHKPISEGGSGLSYERMDELGLEYRYLAQLLQGKITRKQFTPELETRIWQYARRQRTWWRRNKSITWYEKTADIRSSLYSPEGDLG